ncbi:MAG: DNA methyltransferase [Pseudomonadota bacterium]
MQNNTIICGDAAATLKTLPENSVDLIVTDPPYLCNYRDREGRRVRNDDNAGGVLPVFPELFRVLRPGSYCALFCGWSAIAAFSGAWEAAGFRTLGHIVWHKRYASAARHVQYRHESAWLLAKGNPRPPGDPLPDVLDWTYSGNRNHPTEKAVEVIAPLVRAFSQPGDLVLDPFLGSGTTAVAAALAGRRSIGVELEERYCALARKRLAGVERFRADAERAAA